MNLVSGFQRYETAIENKLYRAINQLERLQRTQHGDSFLLRKAWIYRYSQHVNANSSLDTALSSMSRCLHVRQITMEPQRVGTHLTLKRRWLR
jgi:hypothetical protein